MSALAFSIVALVALALGAYLLFLEVPRPALRRRRNGSRQRSAAPDPGAERRAERRARMLLKSIVNRDEWEMYRDLGFICVAGHASASDRAGGYGYLIYPHKPIVSYLAGSNTLLSEYCVEFPDRSESLRGSKLPDSDDVLAKWMMIKADEERLMRDANLHLPGRQVDPQQVRRDLWRLKEWERARSREQRSPSSAAQSSARPAA